MLPQRWENSPNVAACVEMPVKYLEHWYALYNNCVCAQVNEDRKMMEKYRQARQTHREREKDASVLFIIQKHAE